MKKFTASLITGFLMAAGLLFVSNAAPASAAPYPGTVTTSAKIGVKKAVVPKGATNTFRIKVSSVGAGGTPKGSVKIAVIKKNADSKSKVYLTKVKSLKAGKAKYTTPKMTRKGKYRVVATYLPKAGSVWKSSKAKAFFVVR